MASALCALPAFAQGEARILSIGGSVTEIVHALDQGHRLIARDTTSTFPPEVTDLPDVGYARALSPEGVLSVNPSHILAIDDAGPPETIEVLKASGIPFTSVPDAMTAPASCARSRWWATRSACRQGRGADRRDARGP